MKKMWKRKTIQAGDIIATVINTGEVSSVGVANGRMVPVVILQPDEEGKINSIVKSHIGVTNGSCESQWGRTYDGDTVVLHLGFLAPVASKILIPFDVIRHGAAIDQIIHTQCMYLMTGDSGTRLLQNLHQPRILLEIPSRDFVDEWNLLYKKKYCEHLRKTARIPRKDVEAVFEKIREEISCIQKFRAKQ